MNKIFLLIFFPITILGQSNNFYKITNDTVIQDKDNDIVFAQYHGESTYSYYGIYNKTKSLTRTESYDKNKLKDEEISYKGFYKKKTKWIDIDGVNHEGTYKKKNRRWF